MRLRNNNSYYNNIHKISSFFWKLFMYELTLSDVVWPVILTQRKIKQRVFIENGELIFHGNHDDDEKGRWRRRREMTKKVAAEKERKGT